MPNSETTDSARLAWLGGQERVIIERWDDTEYDDPPLWGVQIDHNHWFVGDTIYEAIDLAIKKKQKYPEILEMSIDTKDQ